MPADGGNIAVLGGKDQVIHQQAHAHAAIGRFEQTIEQKPSGSIRLPDEILRIDGYCGMVNQRQAPVHGLVIMLENQKAGLAGSNLFAELCGDFRQHTGFSRR